MTKKKSKVKKSRRRYNEYLNLLVSDKNQLRFVKLRTVYSKSFISKFGLVTIPTIEDFMEFKEDIKNNNTFMGFKGI